MSNRHVQWTERQNSAMTLELTVKNYLHQSNLDKIFENCIAILIEFTLLIENLKGNILGLERHF